jgi:hypothetical protein
MVSYYVRNIRLNKKRRMKISRLVKDTLHFHSYDFTGPALLPNSFSAFKIMPASLQIAISFYLLSDLTMISTI